MHRSVPTLVMAVMAVLPHDLRATEPFELAITGAAGASFAGKCTLTTTAGDHTVELTGTVPLQRIIHAERLTCRFKTTDRIVVDVIRGNSRSRSATHGGVISFGVR